MASVLKRLRTTGGFGVHSPMAFAVITEILRERPGYGYYAYKAIDAGASSRRERHVARLIHRLAVRFGGVKLAGSFTPFERTWAGTPGQEAPLLIKGRPEGEAARRAMTAGMSFTSGEFTLILPWAKLPLTHYYLYF